MSLDNKKAPTVFWGLVQIQPKSEFFFYHFRFPNKHYCLINPKISLNILILQILYYLNYDGGGDGTGKVRQKMISSDTFQILPVVSSHSK